MLAPYAARLALLASRELRRDPIPFLGEARLPMRVWPTDIDFYLHVNNGGYLTLMDIGRYQLALRTGLLRVMLERSWWPVVASARIRFRRELRLLERFELVSRLVGWQARWCWFEQRFERGGAVHAKALVKAVVRHRGRALPFDEVAATLGWSGGSPPLPDLERWEENRAAPITH